MCARIGVCPEDVVPPGPARDIWDLRQREPSVRVGVAAAESGITGTLYRLCQISDKQPLRGTQRYLTKLPLAVIRETQVLQ